MEKIFSFFSIPRGGDFFSIMVCIYFFLAFFFPVHSQEYVNQTLKQHNLRFRFPFTWRWNSFQPTQNENKVFEAFSPGKKVILQIYSEPTKSLSVQKPFHKFQKKWALRLESGPEFVSAEFPNLQHIGTYMSQFKSENSGKNYTGYFLVGTDGLSLYYFRIEAESSEFDIHKPILQNILLSIEMIYDWNHICCALCLKEIRYSARRSTICTDFIVENPCHLYLKNAKMDYEKCK